MNALTSTRIKNFFLRVIGESEIDVSWAFKMEVNFESGCDEDEIRRLEPAKFALVGANCPKFQQ